MSLLDNLGDGTREVRGEGDSILSGPEHSPITKRDVRHQPGGADAACMSLCAGDALANPRFEGESSR